MQGAFFLRLDTMTSAYFSFLLAVPVIIGAVILQFSLETLTLDYTTLFTGFLSAYIVGALSLYLLLKIAYKGNLKYFSIYLLSIGFLILFFYHNFQSNDSYQKSREILRLLIYSYYECLL